VIFTIDIATAAITEVDAYRSRCFCGATVHLSRDGATKGLGHLVGVPDHRLHLRLLQAPWNAYDPDDDRERRNLAGDVSSCPRRDDESDKVP